VIGAGPAATFAALAVGPDGLFPAPAAGAWQAGEGARAPTLRILARKRPFDPKSNVQFGEGWSRFTFLDGKLLAGQVRESPAPCRKDAGGFGGLWCQPPTILSLHRPHIGTVQLATVVRGGCAPGSKPWVANPLSVQGYRATRDRKWRRDSGTKSELPACGGGAPGLMARSCPADQVVLAVVIAPADTFAMLHRQGVASKPRRFRIRLRIEHPQPIWSTRAPLGGPFAGHDHVWAPAAEYKLVHHCRQMDEPSTASACAQGAWWCRRLRSRPLW